MPFGLGLSQSQKCALGLPSPWSTRIQSVALNTGLLLYGFVQYFVAWYWSDISMARNSLVVGCVMIWYVWQSRSSRWRLIPFPQTCGGSRLQRRQSSVFSGEPAFTQRRSAAIKNRRESSSDMKLSCQNVWLKEFF